MMLKKPSYGSSSGRGNVHGQKEKRRDGLSVVYEILSSLMPPNIDEYWRHCFGDVPDNSLPLEPPLLSICDLSRAVNLREDRLRRYRSILQRRGFILCEGVCCYITYDGVQLFTLLHVLFNSPMVSVLIEDLENTTFRETSQRTILDYMS